MEQLNALPPCIIGCVCVLNANNLHIWQKKCANDVYHFNWIKCTTTFCAKKCQWFCTWIFQCRFNVAITCIWVVIEITQSMYLTCTHFSKLNDTWKSINNVRHYQSITQITCRTHDVMTKCSSNTKYVMGYVFIRKLKSYKRLIEIICMHHASFSMHNPIRSRLWYVHFKINLAMKDWSGNTIINWCINHQNLQQKHKMHPKTFTKLSGRNSSEAFLLCKLFYLGGAAVRSQYEEMISKLFLNNIRKKKWIFHILLLDKTSPNK